jgi:tetratricopeptide (TPR) repeat protein
MGNYAAADTIFTRLTVVSNERSRPGHEYLSVTRRASLAWMRGRVPEALELMRRGSSLAEKAHLPPENVAWTHFMLGQQLFQSGNLADAESEMKASLSAYPFYHRALAGLAQIRAAQHRFNEAAESYRRAIGIVPLPLYASALGDIYRRSGKGTEAEKQYALVEYIGQLGALNKQVYNRELALFYADHDRRLADALVLAQRELEKRHDVYTWDALAWALCKAGRPREARDAMQKALALGTRDAMLFFHAAAIERQLGNSQLSSDYARKSLAMNPEFHIFYADQARQWLASSRSAKAAERGARDSN